MRDHTSKSASPITNHIKKGCNINEDGDIMILKLHNLHKNGTPRLIMIPHQIIWWKYHNQYMRRHSHLLYLAV